MVGSGFLRVVTIMDSFESSSERGVNRGFLHCSSDRRASSHNVAAPPTRSIKCPH